MLEDPFRVEDPKGNLYIIADSHLDFNQAPYTEFIEMLDSLPEAQVLVCLGDLFKVWLALPKYWTKDQRQVLDAFRRHRDRGRVVVFIAGNREVLLPRNSENRNRDPFPFTHLSLAEWKMNWGGLRLGFIHGDTLNSQDLQYLRWRTVTHSHAFEKTFRLIPGPLAHWIAERVEALLAGTNQEFKILYPEEEVLRFAKQELPGVDHYFVGHFHLDREIRISGLPGILRLVPDWLGTRKLLRIDPQGRLTTTLYRNGKFSSLA